MNEKYSFDVKMSMSRCDFRWQLGVPQAADIFMDAATDHADVLGVGFDKMTAQNLFWMAARCRYRFHRMPKALEEVKITTWPGKIKYAICHRYYTMTQGDELLIEGMTEWVIYNTKENKLETNAPEVFKFLPFNEEIVCEGKKIRMSRDFSNDVELGRYTVRSTDIDIGHHMNNVAYIRAMMSMFSTEELETLDIRELEINYIAQCMEGEELSFRRRDTVDGMDIGVLHADGSVGATIHLIIGK